jgi:tRNA U34 2-thiouridine synthase MnmA/TrmU
MEETGARFIATGEVVGQRPMSQRRDSMISIEKRSGLDGLLLRPLSAKILEPAIPELKGWVDRERLLGIRGRGRREQFAYAKQFGLQHGAPGGGCLLTQKEIGERFIELRSRRPEFSLSDFKLLAYGRHFRIGESLRLVVGRDHGENELLEKLALPGDCLMSMDGMEGPLAIARGETTDENIKTSASIVARYSRARESAAARVMVQTGPENRIVGVRPADDALCDRCRIRESQL